MHLESNERNRAANRITLIGSAANLGLSAAKLAAGILGNSTAMVADAIHSVSDLGTDLIVLVSMRLSGAPRDRDHHYGHGKFETVAALLVGVALLAVGGGLLVSSVGSIVEFARGASLPEPGVIALVAAAVSIVVKEILYRVTRRVGRQIGSSVIEANAWHHRSDAFSSVGALVGIGGAMALGPRFRVLDPIAGVAISAVICWVAVRIVMSAMRELVEASVEPEIQERAIGIATRVAGVTNPHGLRMRRVGPYMAIDLHIRVDTEKTVGEGHDLAHRVEEELAREFGSETIVTIHIEPERVRA